jgi:hypothetical protein
MLVLATTASVSTVMQATVAGAPADSMATRIAWTDAKVFTLLSFLLWCIVFVNFLRTRKVNATTLRKHFSSWLQISMSA